MLRGLLMPAGELADMKELKIWEPYLVKSQTIKTSIEAACMLLRIDDIHSGVSKDKRGGGAGGAGQQDEETVRVLPPVRRCCVGPPLLVRRLLLLLHWLAHASVLLVRAQFGDGRDG